MGNTHKIIMQNKTTLKQRLAEFLAYLNIGQAKFAETVGLSKGFANNAGDSIRSDNLQKISNAYPELNLVWLIMGEGEMLKEKNTQKTDEISHSGGFVGQMTCGYATIDGLSKDETFQKQEERVGHTFEAHLSTLEKFHDIMNKKEDYIRQQDNYISTIVKESYHRNERNMERIDKLIEQQNLLMDRMLAILEKKL
jgi:hypothetical protein